MKSKSAFRLVRTGSPAAFILAGALAALLATPTARAADFAWDPADDALGGNGTWDDAVSFFWDSGTTPIATNGNLQWANGATNNAYFGGLPGLVTLGSNITAGALNFSTPGYLIDTATLGLTLNSGITANESATLQSGVGGSVILGAGNTWSVAAAKTLTVNAAISGTGFGLTKTGPGVLTLSGTNTYDGGTTVSAGTLLTTAAAALPVPTSGSVIFNGGTLGVRVGGSGWTTGQVDALLGNANKISGTLGIDTTNGDLTQWTPFTTTNLGPLGLAKLGSGNLTLNNAASTYTGKTSVFAGTLNLATNVYLTNIGAPGPLGAPTGAEATIDLYNGTTLQMGNTNPRQHQSTNRSLNLAGDGPGTVSLRFNDNDTNFAFGGVTATGTGAKTLALFTGASGNGDRESLTFNGPITDVTGDSSALSLQVTLNCQTASASFVNLNGGVSFTGPITLIKGANLSSGILTIGGTLTTAGGTNFNAVPGSGTLGGGTYAGNISLDTATNIAYASSANQTLSGLISGNGGLLKLGLGTLTTSNANTYAGATTISGGLLRVNGVNTGGGATTINQGNQGGSLGGTGTIPGTVTAAVGGAINLLDGAVGTLTLGSTLTLSGTAALPNSLYFELGDAGSSDKIVTAGAHTATTANGVQVYLNQLPSTTGSGQYTLIQGGAASTFTGYTLGTTRSGHNLYSAFGASGNNLVVTAGAGTAGDSVTNHYWKGDTSVWNTQQWYSDPDASLAATTPGYSSNVRFAATTPGNLTNTLGTDYEINSLTVDSGVAAVAINAGNMLTIDATTDNGNAAGNGITVNNTATNTIATKVGLGNSQTWTVGTGATLTVSGVISDFGAARSITKTGAGTLVLAGINTFSGGLTINQGSVNLNTVGTATTSALSGGGAITLDPTLGNVSLLFNSSAVAGQIANPINVTDASGGIAVIGTGASTANNGNNTVFSGPITLNGAGLHLQTLGGNNSGSNLVVSGGITGAGDVWLDGTTPSDPQSYTLSNLALNNSGAVTVNATQPNAGKSTAGTVTISSLIGPNVTGLTQNSGATPALGYNTFIYPLILSGANTFNGPTSVLKGELRFNSIKNVNSGLPNALGQPSLANSTITLGSGTNPVQLTYNGPGDTTDRVIDLAGTTGRVAIDNSATGGLLKFTSNLTATGTGAKILNLQGSTGFGAEMAGAIVDSISADKTTLFKAGTGTWTLSGANTYTGTTTVIAGSLIVSPTGTLGLDTSGNNVAVLPGANVGLGSASSLGASQTLTLNSNAGALGGIGVGSTMTLPSFTNNTGTAGGVFGINYAGTNDITSLATLDTDLNANSGGGTGHWSLGSQTSGTFNGGSLAAANDSIYRLGGGGGTLTLPTTNLLSGGNSVRIGAILSNGTAVQQSFASPPTTMTNGGGSVVISAAQDYTGSTTINAGTLVLNGNYSGGGAIITAGAGVLNEASGAITGATSSVTINSNGTSILAGTNTYTGDTTVNFGTLSLTGIIDGGSALKVGGGTFSYAKTGTNTQGVNGLTVNPGNSTVNSTVATNTLKLAGITRAAGNGTVNFGTVTGAITTTASNTNGIIGPWATTGATTTLRYTVANGDAAAITGLTGTAAATAATLTDTTGTVNYDLALATGTIGAAGFSGNTIRYTGAANTLAPGATSFTVNGLMNASGGAWTIGPNPITIGANKELVITTNAQAVNISSAIQNSGSDASGLTFSSVGAAGSAAGVLTLTGTNLYTGPTTVNSGTLRFTGATGKLSTASAISLNGAGILLFDGATRTQGTDFASSISGTGRVIVNNVATLTLSGANSYSGGTLIYNGNNDSRVLFDNSGSLGTGPITFGNGTTYLGSTLGTPLTLSNRIVFIGQDKNANFGKQGFGAAGTGDLTFTDTVSLNTGLANGQFVNVSDSTNVTFAGPVGGSGLYLNKSGTGTLTLSGANTYTGQTRVSGGTLSINTIQDTMSTTPNSLGLPGAGVVITNANNSIPTNSTIGLFTGGTLKYTGSTAGSSDRVVNLATAAGGAFALDASGSIPFALSGGITNAGTSGTSTLTLTGTGDGSESGAIINGTGSNVTALTKNGGGTWTLSGPNSYSGATEVQGGTLLINGSNTGPGEVNVGGSGTLGGTGMIAGAINVTGVLSPGASVETLGSGALTLNDLSKFAYEVNSSVALTVGADLQKVTGDLGLNGTVTLNLTDIAAIDTAFTTGTIFSLINYTGVWNSGLFTYNAVPLGDDTQFSFGGNVWQIDYNAATGGANFSGEYAGDTDSFVNITAVSGATATAYQTWIRGIIPAIPASDQDPGDDPDHDGATNLDEFAFGGIPNDASKKGLVFGLNADSSDAGTANEMILTLAVRTGVAFATPGSPAQSNAMVDGLNYAIQGSTDLTQWTVVVTPVATINPGLPTLPANYQYLSFSLNGSDGLPGKGFLRAQVTMP